MAGIKALRKIQMGAETVAGTAVSATALWRGLGVGTDTRETTFVEEDIGLLGDALRTYVAKTGGEVTFEGIATFEQLPYFFQDLESLYASSHNIKVRAAEGWMAHYIGEILLTLDNPELSKAEHWIQKAIETDQKNRMRFRLGWVHALYAGWFKKKGDLPGAKEQLIRAIDIFTECGADGWVVKYRKELDLLQ